MRKISKADAKASNRQSCIRFDSYAEYVEYAQGPKSANNAHKDSSRHDNGKDWDLGLGWDGAVQCAQQGWSEVRSDIEGIASEVSTRVGNLMRDEFGFEFDVTGTTVDVGRMMSGEPECMIQPVMQQVPRDSPVVTVVVEACVSASMSADTYLKRGATILALLDVLRIIGIPAEVYLSSDNGITCHLIPLVEAGQHVDVDELAFALAHPGAFRRIGFAAWEADEPALPFGYGSAPTSLNKWTREEVTPTIALNGVSTSIGEAGDVVRKPVDWIIAQLKGAGLEVND